LQLYSRRRDITTPEESVKLREDAGRAVADSCGPQRGRNESQMQNGHTTMYTWTRSSRSLSNLSTDTDPTALDAVPVCGAQIRRTSPAKFRATPAESWQPIVFKGSLWLIYNLGPRERFNMSWKHPRLRCWRCTQGRYLHSDLRRPNQLCQYLLSIRSFNLP